MRDVFAEVAADLAKRNALGAAQHGGRALDPHEPGRDWLQELLEELEDACVYIKAEIIKRDTGCK